MPLKLYKRGKIWHYRGTVKQRLAIMAQSHAAATANMNARCLRVSTPDGTNITRVEVSSCP